MGARKSGEELATDVTAEYIKVNTGKSPHEVAGIWSRFYEAIGLRKFRSSGREIVKSILQVVPIVVLIDTMQVALSTINFNMRP